MITVYAGYDEREAPGFHTFVSSLIRRASKPVRIIPLSSRGLPQGSNTFTLSRFLAPSLNGFTGHAIFVDACDMMMLADIAELDALYDPKYAVQVVKHPDYESQHQRKYIGTEMECAQTNYPRKNWASVMLMNCAHSAWFGMTPQAIELSGALPLLQFDTFHPEEIGELPREWNVLVDEGQSLEGAKVLHWTCGIPTFKHYRNARGSKDWFREFDAMAGAVNG